MRAAPESMAWQRRHVAGRVPWISIGVSRRSTHLGGSPARSSRRRHHERRAFDIYRALGDGMYRNSTHRDGRRPELDSHRAFVDRRMAPIMAAAPSPARYYASRARGTASTLKSPITRSRNLARIRAESTRIDISARLALVEPRGDDVPRHPRRRTEG